MSAPEDLSAWLERNGLGACAATLREHDIDLDILPDLGDADLAGIGLALGTRRRLMKAAALLRVPPAAAPLATVPLPAAQGLGEDRLAAILAPPSAPHAAGERRHLTVMFCDLVDSTGMSARLDAEDWHDLVAAYQKSVAEAVGHFGGHVAKNLGDGALIYFGYPQAQENDAERAVRAGLAIQDGLAALNRKLAGEGKAPLAARVGLHAGLVVLADGADVFGEVPNVAARVQSVAQPGWVLISPAVQRPAAGLFVVEDQGAQRLKGVPEPLVLYRVVRASGRRGRLHGVAGNKPTPLVGTQRRTGADPGALGSRAPRPGPTGPDYRRGRPGQIAAWPRNSAPGWPRRRIPGSKPAAASSCRTLRFIRSSPTSSSVSAAATKRRSGAWRRSRNRCPPSASFPRKRSPCWRRSSTCPCPTAICLRRRAPRINGGAWWR